MMKKVMIMTTSYSRLPKHSPKSQQGLMLIGFLCMVAIIAGLVFLAMYAYQLDKEIVNKFENRRWDIPATVYSRPLLLEKGGAVSDEHLQAWLSGLDYVEGDIDSTGRYQKDNNVYVINTRGFDYGDGKIDPAQLIEITFKKGKIDRIRASKPPADGLLRLEPIEMGGIYPENNEDRVVLKKGEVPKALVDALIATEDRSFYEHYGVSLRGTTRALVANITGGSTQGGSTITQQLVKNFYLSSDRTLKRKANEALMALLLERHYSKDAILLTYLNEINLGQNGNRSVNGFGVAAKFYFNKPLSELHLDQHALLVGMAKGSSYYNPRKHPERALARRNTVLHNMLVMGKISQADYDKAKERPLGVVEIPAIAKTKFPDFFDAVHRELKRHYRDDDLRSAGLKIISTLDPIAQMSAERAFRDNFTKKSNKAKNLQGALVSADPITGELVAIVGSVSDFTGFNRAIDSKRQVGSLLKPAIYLTAIQSGKYNWASPVNDEPIAYRAGKSDWTPKNYGGRSYGNVPMLTALANSYNQSAVNVGMKVGGNSPDTFIKQLRQLGVESNIPPYPSVMLGAVDMSPMQMLGVYQVFASGGYHTPIHSIRSVISEQGKVLQRNDDIKSTVRIPADVAYVTNFGLQEVVKDGTATKNMGAIGTAYKLAGKTGTTNDARDAWFAGFSGNYVSVVWVGRDDNEPIGLTGGDGALPIWVDYMKRLNLTPVNFKQPKGVTWLWLEAGTGLLSDQGCERAVYVPVLAKHTPKGSASCLSGDYGVQEEYADNPVSNRVRRKVVENTEDEVVYGEVLDEEPIDEITDGEVVYGETEGGF